MQYTPENLEGLRQPTLRSLYKEMRKEYRSRLAEMKQAGYEWSQSYQNMKDNMSVFEGNINRMTNKQLRYYIPELENYLSSPYTSVDWLEYDKERTLSGIAKMGVHIKEADYPKLLQFLSLLNEMYKEGLYDSKDAVEFFERNSDLDLDEVLARYVEEF
jgi:hypothetical protein